MTQLNKTEKSHQIYTKLKQLDQSGSKYFKQTSQSETSRKMYLKMVKKEIHGDLIDFGINNLRRFTEIKLAEKLYRIRKYHQNE
ncbi:hypothetical protein [Kordia sp.]|uniref:hypothetical protein n=1 Tax=Kordia sp. TaxID=1965332 RepID=UPI0025C41F73|nr:hypothetical protein [Kordia sp.]MCH2193128.1 hypothetical protein [Kordia sp.]